MSQVHHRKLVGKKTYVQKKTTRIRCPNILDQLREISSPGG